MSHAVDTATQAARDLIESVLGKDRTLAREYPLVFDAGAHAELVSIEFDGRVRSACALLERELVMPDVRVHAGFIGSVVTEGAHRGQGLASRVLARAEAELARRGCVVAILWADERGFYERRGYRPFGAEVDLVVQSAHRDRLPEPIGVREFTDDDALAIHELYARHPERVERSEPETRALLGAPNMDVLVCERWGRVSAYACVGRGHDLQGVLHEWAGDGLAVAMLVRAHLERQGERGRHSELFVMAPPSAVDLTARLISAGASATTGILGLAKILDSRAAAEICAERLDRRKGLRVEAGPPVALVSERGRWESTPETLLELLFAARGGEILARNVAREVEGDADALPLAPFIWGLDSI